MDTELFDQLPLEKVTNYHAIGGGDINQAFELEDQSKTRYLLLLQPHHSKKFFQHEVTGLKLMAQTVLTPKVLAYGDFKDDAYLLLSYVAHQPTGDQYKMGKELAQLHRRKSPNGCYGFEENFTIGTYHVDNSWNVSWNNFFINQRLEDLKKLIKGRNLWTSQMEILYQKALLVFKQLMQDHQPAPALLHGDLWAGNFLFDLNGDPVFIDPSLFYGDREFDIGITRVFGGFTKDFYQGYNDEYPLEKGAEKRIPFYQLYYLMFHLSQFGVSYQGSVLSMLKLCAGI